jgi:4-hydroxy-tetrahydrodipicolinate reductase
MSKEPLNVAISGAAGRMGIALIKALSTHPTLRLTAAGIRPGTAQLTRSHFEQAGISFAGDMLVEKTAELLTMADAVVDFSAPEHAVGLAGLAAANKKILISGTTGLNSTQKEALIRAGESTRVVWSANMSVGVNLLMALVEHAAHTLPDADIEILEMHHRHKVDAPSGTAVALGDAAARGRGVSLPEVWVKTRDGHTGPRIAGKIGFSTLRGGDVIGDHTVMFAGQGERLELSHKASSRDIFARGALAAAAWAANKPNGFYTMRDVVKL